MKLDHFGEIEKMEFFSFQKCVCKITQNVLKLYTSGQHPKTFYDFT